ncbi:TIR domain-containing protein [Arthrobacter sp. MSA 4-2]|uniref:LuxR C-terminal-related transcriptional regulator n=1 Tax=Arthrobacter sp. MSA 4-2 TaxID=2794349 RepID=UPI0018E87BA7|nr:LuxR C-terminal-related transcriptional regulator [Arthrobacter sp. MSA 4-2]MBJ2120638.1 TIR domain-containing protein [Arthrobacter sp. MSA 4-2]
MKVFISWSGRESKQVALLLKPWLKRVIQAAEPWMSDVDILPGSRWSEGIGDALRASDFGIICVTPGNRGAEWLNFEAGALSMAIGESDRRVVPLLIGFEDRNALSNGPLGVFNTILFTDEDMWKLILTLNGELESSLDGSDLREIFDILWPRLRDQALATLHETSANKEIAPSTSEMFSAILENVVAIRKHQVSVAEHQTAPSARPTRRSNRPMTQVEESSNSQIRRLTARERDVATLVIEGASNREVANKLNVSARTVEGMLYQIFAKTGTTSREELSILGFLGPEDQ